MNAEQYLKRIENKRLNSKPLYSRKEMIDFAEKYAKQLTLTDVGKCNCDGNDDVFEEQYVLQHLINNTWQVVGEKTNTVWKQGEKEDCIKWMDL